MYTSTPLRGFVYVCVRALCAVSVVRVCVRVLVFCGRGVHVTVCVGGFDRVCACVRDCVFSLCECVWFPAVVCAGLGGARKPRLGHSIPVR